MDADICIIGGGPAGVTIAQRLAGLRFQVILLEAGGLKFCHESQQHYRGRSVGHPYYALENCRLRFFGGSSNFWGGWCRPLDADDFEVRSWVPHSGWPFPKLHLENDYARAHKCCDAGPYDYCDDLGAYAEKENSYHENMSYFEWTAFQIAPTRFGRMCRGLLRGARNVRVMLHGAAVEIELAERRKRAEIVHVRTSAGNRFEVRTKAVILAGGGIENARLLLASRSKYKGGLGNENDLVGRFFADHLYEFMGAWKHNGRLVAETCEVRRIRGVSRRLAWRTSDALLRQEQLLRFGATFHNADDPHDLLTFRETRGGYESASFLLKSLARGEWPDCFRDHLVNCWSEKTRSIALAYRKVVKPRPVRFVMGCRAEQAPNPASRITLIDAKDELGLPRVELEWKLSDQDVESLKKNKQYLEVELERQGFEMVAKPQEARVGAIVGAAHHMGTTRMHRDPSRGVVDEHCRVHGVGNLYVAGSSVFPTSGWANPTLTIVALSLRLADHLRGQVL